eukprot:tig00021428_g21142.t1
MALAERRGDAPHGKPAHNAVSPAASALAGVCSGAFSTIALHPLDVVKVRLQVHEGLGRTTHIPHYRGTVHAFRTMVAEEGLAALYRGLAPATIAAAASWGCYFYGYQIMKDGMRQLRGGAELGMGDHFVCSASAGVIGVLLTNPIWLLKTRMQAPPPTAPLPAARRGPRPAQLQVGRPEALREGAHYRGMLDGARRIAAEEGLRGFYRGVTPALALTCHGAVQFAAYEELKRVAERLAWVGAGAAPGSDGVYLAIGAASKLVATLATYPLQVVKSRIMQRPVGELALEERQRPWPTALRTWRNEGVRGFYKGLVASVLRTTPSAAVTLFAYEVALRHLTRLFPAARPAPAPAHRAPALPVPLPEEPDL